MIPGSWKLVQHCGKRVMLDATFLTGRFKGTLHLAATLDANNEISILAFSIGGNESESTWRHFLQFIQSRFGCACCWRFLWKSASKAIMVGYTDNGYVLRDYQGNEVFSRRRRLSSAKVKDNKTAVMQMMMRIQSWENGKMRFRCWRAIARIQRTQTLFRRGQGKRGPSCGCSNAEELSRCDIQCSQGTMDAGPRKRVGIPGREEGIWEGRYSSWDETHGWSNPMMKGKCCVIIQVFII